VHLITRLIFIYHPPYSGNRLFSRPNIETNSHDIPQQQPHLRNSHKFDTQQVDKPTFTSEEQVVSQEIAINVLALSQELTRRKLESRINSKYEVLSPISVTSALHLAFLGSKNKTFEELNTL
jgi:hypothetical protein